MTNVINKGLNILARSGGSGKIVHSMTLGADDQLIDSVTPGSTTHESADKIRRHLVWEESATLLFRKDLVSEYLGNMKHSIDKCVPDSSLAVSANLYSEPVSLSKASEKPSISFEPNLNQSEILRGPAPSTPSRMKKTTFPIQSLAKIPGLKNIGLTVRNKDWKPASTKSGFMKSYEVICDTSFDKETLTASATIMVESINYVETFYMENVNNAKMASFQGILKCVKALVDKKVENATVYLRKQKILDQLSEDHINDKKIASHECAPIIIEILSLSSSQSNESGNRNFKFELLSGSDPRMQKANSLSKGKILSMISTISTETGSKALENGRSKTSKKKSRSKKDSQK